MIVSRIHLKIKIINPILTLRSVVLKQSPAKYPNSLKLQFERKTHLNKAARDLPQSLLLYVVKKGLS